MTKKTVLITAAGTATSVNIIKSLAALGSVRIVTTDSNPASMIASPTAWQTSHHQVPLASNQAAFIDAVAQIAQSENVDAIYPVHDLEILAIASARGRFAAHVKTPLLSAAVVGECNDKWANFQKCHEAALPVPDTFLGSQLRPQDLATPLVRKPRRGVGSVGVRRVSTFDELSAEDLNEEVIFQIPCETPEYTIDVLALDDYFGAVVRERLETKAGVCTKARVSFDANLTALSRRVADAFGLQGMFCFQVMRGADDDSYRIVDINPRCGGGTALTDAAGFPIYGAYFSTLLDLNSAEALKEACRARERQGGTAIVCRYYEEVVTFEAAEPQQA